MATKRIDGFSVKHAPGISASRVQAAVQALASEKRLVNSASCPVIIFRGKRGGVTAVQRCENRSLKKGAKARYERLRDSRKICIGKNHRFKRCR